MAKKYPDQLAEWVSRSSTSRRDRNLAMFLAVRDDALEGLKAGYPAKTVWRNLRESGRIAFSYDAFLGYLRRHGAHTAQEPAKVESVAGAGTTPKTKPENPAGFTFNAVPRKEELL